MISTTPIAMKMAIVSIYSAVPHLLSTFQQPASLFTYASNISVHLQTELSPHPHSWASFWFLFLLMAP